MKTVTVIFAHTFYEQSVSNRTIIETLKKERPEYNIRHLDAMYPDFKIDVKAEQAQLEKSDVIVYQFPWFWYSAPAILKHWQDMVFEHGWAYGSAGDKLKGKSLILSITTGGPKDAYSPTGYCGYPMEAFYPPFKQSAALTGMKFEQPVESYSMRSMGPGVQEEEIRKRAREHAMRLIAEIESLN